eukprot:250204-Chlamydomonas_euryale.AAC.1
MSSVPRQGQGGDMKPLWTFWADGSLVPPPPFLPSPMALPSQQPKRESTDIRGGRWGSLRPSTESSRSSTDYHNGVR